MFSQKLKAEIDLACGTFAAFTPACLAALKQMDAETGNFNMCASLACLSRSSATD